MANAIQPPSVSTLARYALPSYAAEVKPAVANLSASSVSAQGLVGDTLHLGGKLANHVYHATAHTHVARAALGTGIKTFGAVLGRASGISALVSAGMSALNHGIKVMKGEETMGRAAKMVAVDTAGGAAGGLGAALLSGLTAAAFGALGLAGWPLTVVGAIAGFVGFSWGDNLVRSKVFGFLDYLHDKQDGKVSSVNRAQPANPVSVPNTP